MIIIGSAIDDAAQLYESPKWIGAMLTPSASNEINDKIDIRTHGLTTYDIPLKEGLEKNGYAVNFSQEHVINFIQEYYQEKRPIIGSIPHSRLKSQLKKQLQNQTKIDVVIKYKNTLAFLEHIQKSYLK